MLIAIDGDHQVGKSTIINRLKEEYAYRNDVVFFKFPTYTELGDFARKYVNEDPLVTAMLFGADYRKGFLDDIAPNMNKIVILDRYLLSYYVFQGYLLGVDYACLDMICKEIKYPDVQIVIHRKEAIQLQYNNDSFVFVAKQLKESGKLNQLHIVDNILSGTDNINLEGYNKVIKIIDRNIKLKF